MVSRGARARKPYHHGNLRQALIDATLDIVAEAGLDAVTVRAAATRAGVSSGAPFRHFPTKLALMTAVAEEAMRRFRAEIFAALAQAAALDPLDRLRAMGTAYLRWATANPTYFQVISTRGAIDFDGSEFLVVVNEEARAIMEGLLAEARAKNLLRRDGAQELALQARALVYGLGRMWVDGHFAQWGGERNARAAMARVLDDFIRQLRA